MKAKYFTQLRKKVSYYEVEETNGLFGHFEWTFKGETILALSHKNACERYAKRHYIGKHIPDETSRCWGRFKVKLKDKVVHERHFKYF